MRYCYVMVHPVDLALNGQLAPSALTESEQELYLDRFEESLLKQSELEDHFFALRRRRGVGVGLDDEGRLVYQSPES